MAKQEISGGAVARQVERPPNNKVKREAFNVIPVLQSNDAKRIIRLNEEVLRLVSHRLKADYKLLNQHIGLRESGVVFEMLAGFFVRSMNEYLDEYRLLRGLCVDEVFDKLLDTQKLMGTVISVTVYQSSTDATSA